MGPIRYTHGIEQLQFTAEPPKSPGLQPGDVVYVKEFGHGPYVVVDTPDETLMVNAVVESQGSSEARVERLPVHGAVLVMDKRSKYYLLPPSTLTKREEERQSAVEVVIATACVTGSIWCLFSVLLLIATP